MNISESFLFIYCSEKPSLLCCEQKMATGQIEVEVSDLWLLNPRQLQLPFELKEFHKVVSLISKFECLFKVRFLLIKLISLKMFISHNVLPLLMTR